MNIIDITYALTALIEAIMFIFMFDAFFEKRKKFPIWQYLIGIALLAIMIKVVNTCLLYRFGNALGMILAAVIVSAYFYKASIIKRIFVAVFVWGIFIGALEILVLNMIMFLFGITAYEAINNAVFLVLGVIISKALALVACYAIRVKRQLKQLELGWSYWFLFIAVFSSSILASFMIFWMLNELDNPDYNMMALISSLGLYTGNFFALYLYEYAARQNRLVRIQEQSEQQMRDQLKYMDEIILKQDELRSIRHDMNNQLTALMGYLERSDIEGCRYYLAKITQQLQFSDVAINTGNTALDSIISAKKSLAKSKNITFNLNLHFQKELPIEPEDLCIIFGNALDNAIEACERVLPGHEKWIDLAILQDAHTLLCKISNPTSSRKNDIFTTSKEDKINHGFGLRNIQCALEKYQAEPLIEQKNGCFSLSFIFFV